MARRVFDRDPALHDEAEALRRKHVKPKARFQLVRFAEIALDQTRNYLVQGLIPREGLVVVWGPPKCGKSFWIFDLALHVALGWPYRGRRVVAGGVVYVACEGERGLGARAEAFRQGHRAQGELDPPFYLLTTRLDLGGDADALISDIAKQLEDAVGCAVIVIDTLNRSLRGSESSDEDMGAYVQAADRVREHFRCAVVIIHHCGIDERRPRGHTSLTGAADAQIAVTRNTAGQILAKVEWLKDGAEGEEVASALQTVEFGYDEDGEPITSCVVVAADPAGARAGRAMKLSSRQRRALELLKGEIELHGEVMEPSNHVPAFTKTITRKIWRDACYEGLGIDGDRPDARRQAFNRAVDDLLAKGLVGTWGDRFWSIQPSPPRT
jgi:AAA domain